MTASKPLDGKTAIITGANQGLGLAIATHFVAAGANVMLCARAAELLDQARADVARGAAAGQGVRAHAADVAKPDEVAALTQATLAHFGQVDILVNNAGVYGPKGAIEDVDWAAWVHAIEVNLLGSVLMCRALLPHFKSRRKGKIVQLSGGGATNPLPMLSAYAASKAAVIRFVETLAEEVRGCGIDVNAIAPGALNTRLLDEVLEAGPEKVGREFFERSLRQKQSGGAPLQRGAELAVYLASAASDGITGKLISAIWDPWPALADHADELRSGDIYTLRRIVPADRGKTWGDA